MILQVTEDIHGAVDRQVGALRGRERQLVRQVEVKSENKLVMECFSFTVMAI